MSSLMSKSVRMDLLSVQRIHLLMLQVLQYLHLRHSQRQWIQHQAIRLKLRALQMIHLTQLHHITTL